MTVVGDFSVRGGIKTVVTASYDEPHGQPDARPPVGDEPHRDSRSKPPRPPRRSRRATSCPSSRSTSAPRTTRGLREVRLIHGRGKGVQRGIVQQALERHPLVVEFWDAPESHLGATVARLVRR